jgi:hypothetical protein
MTVLSALLLAVLVQDPAEDPKKEVERLRKENLELRQRLQELEDNALETAREIKRLQGAVELLKDTTAEAPPVAPPGPGGRPLPPGPDKVIRGKVVFVNTDLEFITIGIGKPSGVQVGYRFEILRETFEPGADLPKITKLGVGEVEKFIGGQESMSKLKVVEGKAKDMRPDDLAVAIRGLGPAAPPAKDPKGAATPPREEAPKGGGTFAITGQTGTSFLLDYGSIHGARQTDIVFAYKDGTLKARLRLDKVDKGYSVASLIPGTLVPGVPPPEQGDQIFTRELDKGLTGKVSFLNPKDSTIAIDLRPRDGIKTGQRYEVRRAGARVGTVLVSEVHNWGSWAKPDADTKFEDIQKGDFVQVIEEK